MAIDLSPIYAILELPADQLILKLMINIGWIPIAVVLVWGAFQLWMDYVQTKFASTLKYTFLAIDIPRGNAVSPKSVENIFTYFGGAHGSFNLIEIYWQGMFQQAFSFEIVSIEGYTQFLIRTPVHFVNLVESAIYSQYPDAEITEVNDYAEDMPSKFPDEEYDLWGAEFVPAKHWTIPFKTWKSFEHPSGKPEEQFRDPMASLMDACSTLGRGEQLWFQIIVVPIDFKWAEEGQKEIKRIIGEKIPTKKTIIDKVIDFIMSLLSGLGDLVFSLGGEAAPATEEADERFLMMNLKPQQKKQIDAIQDKVSLLGFECKVRFIYLAKKDVMNKPKVVSGFVGYIKQFMDLDLNNLKPDMTLTGTSASYFFVNQTLNSRKTKLMAGYKSRSGTVGKKRFVLNIEELATLWHFPVEAVVKAPLIQKAPGRKSEPPMELPVDLRDETEDELFVSDTGEDEDIFADIDQGLEPVEGEEKEKIKIPVQEEDEEATEEEGIDDDSIFSDEAMAETREDEKKGAPPGNLPTT